VLAVCIVAFALRFASRPWGEYNAAIIFVLIVYSSGASIITTAPSAKENSSKLLNYAQKTKQHEWKNINFYNLNKLMFPPKLHPNQVANYLYKLMTLLFLDPMKRSLSQSIVEWASQLRIQIIFILPPLTLSWSYLMLKLMGSDLKEDGMNQILIGEAQLVSSPSVITTWSDTNYWYNWLSILIVKLIDCTLWLISILLSERAKN